MGSARRCAVTITSCSSLPAAVAVAVSAGAAKTIAVPGALSIAATAAEIFALGFIALPPENLVVIFTRPLVRKRLVVSFYSTHSCPVAPNSSAPPPIVANEQDLAPEICAVRRRQQCRQVVRLSSAAASPASTL